MVSKRLRDYKKKMSNFCNSRFRIHLKQTFPSWPVNKWQMSYEQRLHAEEWLYLRKVLYEKENPFNTDEDQLQMPRAVSHQSSMSERSSSFLQNANQIEDKEKVHRVHDLTFSDDEEAFWKYNDKESLAKFSQMPKFTKGKSFAKLDDALKALHGPRAQSQAKEEEKMTSPKVGKVNKTPVSKTSGTYDHRSRSEREEIFGRLSDSEATEVIESDAEGNSVKRKTTTREFVRPGLLNARFKADMLEESSGEDFDVPTQVKKDCGDDKHPQ